ncbi:MAG: sulfotransferase [Acidobacteriota bacterium]
MDMKRMIFVTGFARGGTTWLRDLLAAHPYIGKIGEELALFRDRLDDLAGLERIVERKIEEHGVSEPYAVEKSPANAPFLDRACRALPQSRFLFIIRDPRDVFISHKRGTREWMGGANSTVEGCMRKTRRYWEGWRRAEGARNLLLVRYEDLHQDFRSALRRIFGFLGLDASPETLERCRRRNDFWRVASRNLERRDRARRKGVVGDWVNFLDKGEEEWFKGSAYWSRFMKEFGYCWEKVSLEKVLGALAEAGARPLSEDDLIAGRLGQGRLNLLLSHDIDSLRAPYSRASILGTARLEARFGLGGIFYFLPLDDPRYRGTEPEEVVRLIGELRQANPRIWVGLHLNAAERFFPAGMEDVGDDHPDMPKSIEYLHRQIDAYARRGVRFRTATAHGYGRRKNRPNNRDSPVFTRELEKRGILLWDTALRPRILGQASAVARLADVGGSISARGLPGAGPIDLGATYRALPGNSLIHFLMHPGNYDFRRPLTLGRRINLEDGEWRAGQGEPKRRKD